MLKLIGVIFVVLGSTGAGVTMAWGARRTLETARQLRVALERMKNEIACHRTALPELMELLSRETGPLSSAAGGFGICHCAQEPGRSTGLAGRGWQDFAGAGAGIGAI